MPTIRLNGKERAIEPGTTVADLVHALGLPSDGIAVAVDREVVPRSDHAKVTLADGAMVEVIRAVGGG